MERIEYVSRMEDYAAGMTLALLHVRRGQKRQTWETIRGWLIYDAILLGALYILNTGWTAIAIWAIVMLLIQVSVSLRGGYYFRKAAWIEARRLYENRQHEGIRQSLWFDSDNLGEDMEDHQIQSRWNSVREVVLAPDCLLFNAGRFFYFVSRKTVTAGDFDRFANEAINVFASAKQREGVEPKVVRSNQTKDIDREPISTGRKLCFGFLWGGVLLFVGGLILGTVLVGIGLVLELTGITHDDELFDRLTEIFAGVFLFGTFISGLTGAVLGAMGVLPGARKKK